MRQSQLLGPGQKNATERIERLCQEAFQELVEGNSHGADAKVLEAWKLSPGCGPRLPEIQDALTTAHECCRKQTFEPSPEHEAQAAHYIRAALEECAVELVR